MTKNLLLDLPEDLFILLPIKCLLSLRCVCKYLRNIITSPAFINMHLLHQSTTASSPPNHQQLNSNQLVLFRSKTPEQVFYSLKFNDGGTGDPCCPEEVNMLDYPIKGPLLIWGSCNGLLCLAQRVYRRDPVDIVCLWNPSTKEYKELPPLQLTWRVSIMFYGFGYDRLNDDYKIIRGENFMATRFGDDTCSTEFGVYTLGTNTWRKISADNNPFKSYRFRTPAIQQTIVFVNGALHWIMSKPLDERGSEIIVSFDIEKEVFGKIQKPNDNFYSHIHVLRGCLCLFEDFFNRVNPSCFNVWMMMDYGVKESWTKLFTFDQRELLNWTRYHDATIRLLRFSCENGETLLIGTKDTLIAYDLMNNKARHNKARRVEFGESVQHLGEIYNSGEIYIESLVSLNSGIYKGGMNSGECLQRVEFDPRCIE